MLSKTGITFTTGLEIAHATPFQKALFEKNVMISIPIFECLLGILKSNISLLKQCFQYFLVLLKVFLNLHIVIDPILIILIIPFGHHVFTKKAKDKDELIL